MQKLHRKRIEAAITVWSNILNSKIENRREAAKLLEELYRRERIEPIRGKTKIRIFDKELATVYLVGRYGLGLEEDEWAKAMSAIFDVEHKAEKAIKLILEGNNPRDVISEIFGKPSEDMIFRVLRLLTTAVLLDFRAEEDLHRLLKRLEDSFPEYRKKFEGFKKFYIAFRMAEQIAAGNVRNRLEKEALKHALCLKFDALKSAPPDSLVREIATQVLEAREFEVNDVLKTEKIEAELG